MLPLIETLSVTSFCFVYHTFSLQDSSQHSSYPHGICCNHLVTSLFYYFNTFSLQNSSWYYSHPHGIWWHLSFIIFILSAFKMALDIHMKIDGISWWHIFFYYFHTSAFKMALDIPHIHIEADGISWWHSSSIFSYFQTSKWLLIFFLSTWNLEASLSDIFLLIHSYFWP